MNRSELVQIISAALFCVLAGLLIVPGSLWMPSMGTMMALALAVIAFGVLAIFVVHEGDGDERQQSHRALAGRVAFLAGATVLLVAIVFESIAHTLDPWLVAALIVMVMGKVGAYVWSDRYQ